MTRNELPLLDAQVQVSACGTTVWVHGLDGSTVGRFSKRFGMDVHTTAYFDRGWTPSSVSIGQRARRELDARIGTLGHA